MKTALILSGGGFKGAFQYGAIKYLVKKGITFDYVAGISAGALNGSMVASGNIESLALMWKLISINGSSEIFEPLFVDLEKGFKIKWKELYNYFFKGQSPFTLFAKGGRERLINKLNKFKSLTSSKPLKEKLKILKLEDFKIPFLTGAVSLNDGEIHTYFNTDFSSDEEFRLFVESSATMPIVCSPIPLIKTKTSNITNLIDGGVRTIVPLARSIEYFKETEENWRIIVVNCNSELLNPDEPSNIAQIGLRALNDIALNELFKKDLQITNLINNFVVASGQETLNGYKHFPLTVISPDGLDLGDTLDSSSEIINYRIEQGYKKAKEIFNL